MPMNQFDLGRVTQIRLLDDKDDVFEPFLLDKIKEIPGRLRPWVYNRKHEQNEVSSRDEAFGDRLMLRHHRVSTGGIYYIEVPQKWYWQVALGDSRGND